uniref:Peptidyl-prolyl cis-trans isomerase n=1 Tax=Kalanchoe fedtschenkoi TaxID=63787 RepID=A0A7N0UJC3_KALFE
MSVNGSAGCEDIAISSGRAERVVIELHTDTTPRTAENFRALCTGEKGICESSKPLHYKGSKFQRVFPEDKICEGGDITGTENLTKKHAGPGVVSMLRHGDPKVCSGSAFFITTARAEQFDGANVVFGQVVEGMDVVMGIMRAGSGASVIVDCGQLNS